MTVRTALAVLLLLAGAGLSVTLLLEAHGEGQSTVNALCGGPESGCASVARSPYSRVGGVPLAALGIWFYLSFLVLLVLGGMGGPEVAAGAASLTWAGMGLGLLVDLYLLAVQALSIHAFCRLCLSTYVLNLLCFALLWRVRTPPGATWRGTTGRLTLGGWSLTSLALAAAVFATDGTLSLKESQRGASLLGTPSDRRQDPGSNELQRAREAAKRLQETLDDPKKLEQYMTEKAAKEFDEAQPQTIDLKDVPGAGPPTAPIHVVVYSDFLCPWCRAAARAFADYLANPKQSAGRVALHYKNYPLDKTCNANVVNTVHAGACWMAWGGLCALDQGQEKFWTYHNAVFGGEFKSPPTKDDVLHLGASIGLDRSKLEACIESQGTKDRLAAQIREAAAAGVQATPTVFINGRKLPRLQDFLLSVDKEAQRLGLPPLSPQPSPPPS
jgi:protein-disulfide isomerase/uncharacterized membrane protein